MGGSRRTIAVVNLLLIALLLLLVPIQAATEPFRRDPGHPQWHHGSFQDHRDTVRKMTHELLHSSAQVLVQALNPGEFGLNPKFWCARGEEFWSEECVCSNLSDRFLGSISHRRFWSKP